MIDTGRVLKWLPNGMTADATKAIENVPDDPRETPAYQLSEASAYLGIPATTIRSWFVGRRYQTQDGPKVSAPLMEPADAKNMLLSFANLAEAHVLQATRDQKIPMSNVRRAIEYMQERWPSSRHLLITTDFFKFGQQLFIKELDPPIDVNATQAGQLGFSSILEKCLRRLERDDTGYPVRIFPLKTNRLVLDIQVASGQPVIKNTRLLASFISSRYQAGDSLEDLAAEYRVQTTDVEEAIAHFKAA